MPDATLPPEVNGALSLAYPVAFVVSVSGGILLGSIFGGCR